MERLSIPLPQRLVAELYNRLGPEADIVPFVEHALETFLERTRQDGDLWRDEYLEGLSDEESRESGDPTRGYQWGPIFLPNGTQLRMEYGGEMHYAAVENDAVVYEGGVYSPSQLAGRIASNTSRNAWRDLWVRLEGRRQWVPADELRRRP